MAKRIAVIVYIPDKADLIQQFFGLYYSMMLHPTLRSSVDFIVGCEAGMQSLFEIDNCIVSHTCDLSRDSRYQFKYLDNKVYGYINSWSHFADQNSIDIIRQYQYALRIDVDTFLSPSLLDIELQPNEILTGCGGYIGGQETIDNILRVSQALQRQHRGIHNIGSTWFARTPDMLELGTSALACARYLLQHEFHEVGDWPRWYALVSTMYAGEIALNDSNLDISISDRFDAQSTSDRAVLDIYSIHCWHTEEYFSKHHYIAGDYQSRVTPLNIESCCDYAFFCSRLSEMHDRPSSLNRPTYLTPAQGIRTAASLLKQSLPKLPAQIIRKLRNS